MHTMFQQSSRTVVLRPRMGSYNCANRVLAEPGSLRRRDYYMGQTGGFPSAGHKRFIAPRGRKVPRQMFFVPRNPILRWVRCASGMCVEKARELSDVGLANVSSLDTSERPFCFEPASLARRSLGFVLRFVRGLLPFPA
jgi:hypothetical protein